MRKTKLLIIHQYIEGLFISKVVENPDIALNRILEKPIDRLRQLLCLDKRLRQIYYITTRCLYVLCLG